MDWTIFWTVVGGIVGLITVGILAIGKIMGFQKSMDGMLTVAQHDVICKDRDAEITKSLKEITDALNSLVKKDALDDIKSTLSDHIKSRGIIDDRQETFRHDVRNSVQQLAVQVAVIQATVNHNKEALTARG